MKFAERIKKFGLTRAFIAALGGRAAKFMELWVVVEIQLVDGFELPSAHEDYDFRQLTLDDALAASQNEDLEMTPDFIRKAFERGDYCFGAYWQGELVAYAWRSFTVAPVNEKIQLRVDHRLQFYGYKTLVLPDHRGTGLIQSVARTYDGVLMAKGIKVGVGYVSVFNLPSLRHYDRQPHHEKIGYAGYLSVGRFVRTFRTPGARRAFTFERLINNS